MFLSWVLFMILSKGKSSSTEDISKKSKQTLEEEIETIELICDLKTHNPLLRNFNNITRWMNLVELTLSNNDISDLPIQLGTLPCLRNLDLSQNNIGISQRYGWPGWLWIMQPEIRNTLQKLNISKNKIGDLPKQLGTLPCLQYLDLSQNNIGIYQRYGWLWIMQPEIRNTLQLLDISKNSITELSDYIGKLNALMVLDISHNELSYLPHAIANMSSLESLNVSYNSLLCLPREIKCLRNLSLYISMNPCITDQDVTKVIKMDLPKLAELSYTILRQNRNAFKKILRNKLIEYMDFIRCCYYCNQYGKAFIQEITSCDPDSLCNYIKMETSEEINDPKIIVEFVRCFPACQK